jgi:signal transduction histidine kinase
LSICYSIVADHKGRIEVDSHLGKGTTFRVLLPAADKEGAQ